VSLRDAARDVETVDSRSRSEGFAEAKFGVDTAGGGVLLESVIEWHASQSVCDDIETCGAHAASDPVIEEVFQ
jgi:hypothetical protein